MLAVTSSLIMAFMCLGRGRDVVMAGGRDLGRGRGVIMRGCWGLLLLRGSVIPMLLRRCRRGRHRDLLMALVTLMLCQGRRGCDAKRKRARSRKEIAFH